MKRRFGKQMTKFDSARPITREATQLGNEMYGDLASEFNTKVPGAAAINQTLQNNLALAKGSKAATLAPGPGDATIDRWTRPTGGLAAVLMAAAKGGLLGAGGMTIAQGLIGSKTAQNTMARPLWSGANGMQTTGRRAARLVPLAPWGGSQ